MGITHSYMRRDIFELDEPSKQPIALKDLIEAGEVYDTLPELMPPYSCSH